MVLEVQIVVPIVSPFNIFQCQIVEEWLWWVYLGGFEARFATAATSGASVQSFLSSVRVSEEGVLEKVSLAGRYNWVCVSRRAACYCNVLFQKDVKHFSASHICLF
jgi:hypothetical protein